MQNKKQFACPECAKHGVHKTFAQRFALSTHMRWHTDEEPFKCTVAGCGETFKWRSGLVNHRNHHDPTKKIVRRSRRSNRRLSDGPLPLRLQETKVQYVQKPCIAVKPEMSLLEPIQLANTPKPVEMEWASDRSLVPTEPNDLANLLLLEPEFIEEMDSSSGATPLTSFRETANSSGIWSSIISDESNEAFESVAF